MKNYLKITLVGMLVSGFMAFTTIQFEPNYATAEVSKIEGFYTFTDSRPVLPFDTLGVVEAGFVSGTQYETIREHLMKRARKAYPEADGLILQLNKKGLDKCVVIKFNPLN